MELCRTGCALAAVLLLTAVACGQTPVVDVTSPPTSQTPALMPPAPESPRSPRPAEPKEPDRAQSPALQLIQEEPKKYPTVNVGGAIQVDAGWFVQDAANLALFGPIADGIAFRRTRLHAFGSVTENVDYRVQMDYAFFGRPTFTDVYFDVKNLGLLGTVRVGQWKQFFGLEEITSFRFNPFLERASIFLFQPFRRTGVGFFNHSRDERFTWAASVFGAGQDQYGGSIGLLGGPAMSTRFTFNPVYESDGRRVLHLGAAYYLTSPLNNTLRFGAIGGNSPEFGLFTGQIGTPSFTSPPNTPSFVDTGVIAASMQNLWGTEFAWVRGPLSIQSEFNFTLVNRDGGQPPAFFWGGYVYTTLFLTGEHRVYNRKQAAFDRIVPNTPFNPGKNGRLLGGAWELGYRLSFIELNATGIDGGALLDHTVGLNWYLNGFTKIQFNYINAMLWRGPAQPSNSHIFAVRGQVDF